MSQWSDTERVDSIWARDQVFKRAPRIRRVMATVTRGTLARALVCSAVRNQRQLSSLDPAPRTWCQVSWRRQAFVALVLRDEDPGTRENCRAAKSRTLQSIWASGAARLRHDCVDDAAGWSGGPCIAAPRRKNSHDGRTWMCRHDVCRRGISSAGPPRTWGGSRRRVCYGFEGVISSGWSPINRVHALTA
jgi:hypothetical protein